MENKKHRLQELRPVTKPNVIDLVAQAGVDVSDWSNFKGGPHKAPVNPRYCYEWCFEQDGIYIFNIWFEHMKVEGEEVVIHNNYRNRQSDLSGVRLGRSRRFDDTMRRAFENRRNPRLIILDRPMKGEGAATGRRLDPVPWTIVSYDRGTGDFQLVRGLRRQSNRASEDLMLESFQEGRARFLYIAHRKRESRLREQKIIQSLQDNDGRLICEVPRCGFDFHEKYGELGGGYAEVHHLTPLSQVSVEGVENNLNDLAVVCSNCHAMIHRGGACRDLEDLIPERG